MTANIINHEIIMYFMDLFVAVMNQLAFILGG